MGGAGVMVGCKLRQLYLNNNKKKNCIGNREAKELICTIHGHELKRGDTSGWRKKGRKSWDKWNSMINKMYLKIKNLMGHYWCIKIQLISGHLFHILLFTVFVNQFQQFFGDIFYGSLYTVSCHLQIITYLLIPFKFGCLLLLSV